MPNETRLEPPDGFGDVASLKCLDCAALEKENVDLKTTNKKIQERVDYWERLNRMSSDTLEAQIESLTAQLAEVAEILDKYDHTSGSDRDLEIVRSAQAKLKAAIEAAGGVK